MKGESGPEDIERFRAIITDRFGLAFGDDRLDQLALVLGERIVARGDRSAEAYLDCLAGASGDAELETLAKHVTVAETYFFRNPAHFRALTETVLPEQLAAARDRRTIRILSAGCATGEEAYSIAILLHERRQQFTGWQFPILAVDLNPAVIQQAVRAVYSQWSLRSTSAELRERYFRLKDRDYALDPVVREMVTFAERNLVGEAGKDDALWVDGAFDVIFFRNVMMYFSADAARTAIERLTRALAPGGYLFLGDAETLRGLSQEFRLLHTNETFYYQRTGRSAEICGREPDRPEPCAADYSEQRPLLSSAAELFASIELASRRIARAAPEAPGNPGVAAGSGDAGAAGARPWNIELGFGLLRQERFDDSIRWLKALPPQAHTDPEVQLLHAVLLTNSGNLVQAEEVCEQLLRCDELNAGGHYLTALCREHRGDRDGAIHHDQIATYLAPPFAMAHFHLGLMAKQAGDLKLARHALARASILFASEDSSRILLFGGGFSRGALVGMCRAELQQCGGGA